MKKLLLLSAFAVFGLSNVNAQDSGDIELGIGLGLNLSNVSDIQGNNNAKSKIGFNLSGSGEYYFSDRWGIKAKLIYDQKGWADGFIYNVDTDVNVITDFKLNYLSVPVMANWHFGSNRNWYLNFGPYIGFVINAEDSELGLDVKEGFKSTDFGLAFGIGYKFEINDNIKLFVEYDGQSGFSDIFEENAGDSIRNGRSSFNVGALFSL
ncbi:porin family protein [Ichthyenterobacterium magnum]|uniref:Opacity protein-like surface antigen n=1 Tax=Ichthyenterobacterium magnum TaxID=1230530 RepID=A0A420DKI9_9FLAO|nr:porin family protein [Ichthyenterobacterium magnum]RKE94729.1 opacity protein-like surface antigen [Ichthyenterobacterium magnum]